MATFRRARPLTAVAIAAAGLAVFAGAAQADPAHNTPSTLTLTGTSSPTLGQTTPINATGFNDPQGAGSSYGHFYLDVYALAASLGPSCPQDYLTAAQNSEQILAVARPETSDQNGNFTNPIAYTPDRTGSFLICGYTDDGTSLGTAASAALPVTVTQHATSKKHKKHKKKKHRRH